MPEAHVKPCYMLEHPKAQGATYAKILEDEAKAEMDNQQATRISDIDLGWLAGFIDGEGYIGIGSYKTKHNHISYSAAIQVSNTDEEMILRAKSIIEKMGVIPYIKTGNLNGRKNVIFVLVVHRMGKIISVLKKVNPFLTGKKKERGELVLEYCTSRTETFKRGSHYNQITEREARIIDLCIAKQHRGASETIRKAQLERSKLLLAKAYLHREKYEKEYVKDPDNHARILKLQRERRNTPEGREKARAQQNEYRKQLNIKRKDALRSVLAGDDIVRPYAKAMGS